MYSLETNPEYGKYGVLYVSQNSDSTLLFYLEAGAGRPAYHSGAMIGQMKILSAGIADFTIISEDNDLNCSISVKFSGDTVYVDTNDNRSLCGFGYGVHADGIFNRIQLKTPEYFIDRSADTTKFEGLDWKQGWP